jgi:hypothetical protein
MGIALAAAFALSAQVEAQESRGQGGQKGREGRQEEMGLRGPAGQDLMEYLYPVDLIRRYSTDIKLTDNQIKQIHKIMTGVGDEVEQLKWDLEKEAQKLVDLVKAGESKSKIYVQMDKIFAVENKIKKKHLGLMIDVRDILTKAQRDFLDKVKSETQGPFPPGRGPLPVPAEAPRPPSMPGPPPPPPGR